MASSRNQILVDVAVNDRGVATEFGKMARAVERFGSVVSSGAVGPALARSFVTSADQAKRLTQNMKQASGAIGVYVATAKRLREAATGYNAIINSQKLQSVEYKKQIALIQEEERNLKALVAWQEQMVKNGLAGGAAWASITRAITETGSKIVAAKASAKTIEDAFEKINVTVNGAVVSMTRFEKSILDAKSSLSAAEGVLDGIARTHYLSSVTEDLIKITQEAQRARLVLDAMTRGKAGAALRTPEIALARAELTNLRKQQRALMNTASMTPQKRAAMIPLVENVVGERAKLAALQQTQAAMDKERRSAVATSAQLTSQAQLQERIGKLRSQDNIAAESAIQLAKRMLTLESQIQQSISAEVTERRAVADAMRKIQDAEVKKGADSIIVQNASNWQKLGIVMKNVGAIWTRNTLMLGSMGNALLGSSAAATVTTGKFAKLGKGIGFVVVALGRTWTPIKNTISGLIKLGQITAGAVVKGFQAMARAAQATLSVMTRVASATANTVKSLAVATAGFVKARITNQQYNKSTGEAVDAEGWHSRSLKGLVGNAVNLNRWINTLGSGVRQMGQAFQNAGMTMSMFISYPLTNWLKQGTTSVLAFDKALIEIRKNADVSKEGLAQIKEEVLSLSMESPTSLQGLSQIFIDAAKQGIAPEYLASFTKVIDQFVVSTDISAEEATSSVARIMNIFYDKGNPAIATNEAFMKTVLGITSAINELGQANPIGEGELVSGTLRAGPAAKAMGMQLEDLLGMMATVASASASPERAGTQLGTALTEVAVKLGKMSKMAAVTDDEFKAMWKDNPTEVFMSMAEAIGSIEDPITRAALAQELFGSIGGKAANIASGGINNLTDNVGLARAAFEDGTSITSEFGRAMDAVSNQIAVLRNQFGYMAVVLGNAVLPVVTKLMTYAIPIVQALAKYFNTLSDSTKLWIVGIAVAAAALGPLLYMIGSLMFSVGIMITGVTSLVTVFAKLASVPFAVISGILGLVPSFRLVSLVLATVLGAMLLFNITLGDVGNYISTFIGNMATWGYNAVAGFANGVIEAGSVVYNAFVRVLEGVASILKAFSPPKEGPLSEIDVWGKNAATAYADGFANADLSGVRNFGNYIGEALEGQIRGLSIKSMGLFDNLAPVLESIVKSATSMTGVDSSEIFNIVSGSLSGLVDLVSGIQGGASSLGQLFQNLSGYLGPFTTDFEKLVGLQLDYNKATDEYNRITTQLENFDAETEKQIRLIGQRIDLSVSERVEMIRKAKIEAELKKKQLQDDQEAAKAKQEGVLDEIDYRKQLIELLQKFLPEASKDTLAPIETSPVEEIGKTLVEAEKIAAEKINAMKGSFDSFTEKVKLAVQEIRGFIDALLGKDVDPNATPAYMVGWEKGAKTREDMLLWYGKIMAVWNAAYGYGNNFAEMMNIVWLAFTNQDPALLATLLTKYGDLGQALSDIGDAAEAARTNVGNFFEAIRRVFTGEEAGAPLPGPEQGALFLPSIGNNPTRPGATLPGKGQNSLFMPSVLQGNVVEEKILSPFDFIIQKLKELAGGFLLVFGDKSPFAAANLSAIAEPLKAIGLMFAKMADLAFDNIGILGGALGGIASSVVSLWGVAGAVAAIAASMLGVQDNDIYGPLVNSLKLIGDGTLGAEIEKQLNANKVAGVKVGIGQQVVDIISRNIAEADWGTMTAELAGKINDALFGKYKVSKDNTIVGPREGGIFDQLISNTDIEELQTAIKTIRDTLLGIILTIQQFVSDLQKGDFKTAASSVLQGLSDTITGILDALIDILAKKETWYIAGTAVGTIAGAIGSAIVNAEWGELFNAKTMTGIVGAFIKGFTDALAIYKWFGPDVQNAWEQSNRPIKPGGPVTVPGVNAPGIQVPVNPNLEGFDWANPDLQKLWELLNKPFGSTGGLIPTSSTSQTGQPANQFQLQTGEGGNVPGQAGGVAGGMLPQSIGTGGDAFFNSILAALTDWVSRNSTSIAKAGQDIASALLGGTSKEFAAATSLTPFNELLSKIGLWINGKSPVFTLGGTMIATDIKTGISEVFTDSEELFGNIITSLDKWTRLNNKALSASGAKVGETLSTAIAGGVGGTFFTNTVSNAITNSLNGISQSTMLAIPAGSLGKSIATMIGAGIQSTPPPYGIGGGVIAYLNLMIAQLQRPIPVAAASSRLGVNASGIMTASSRDSESRPIVINFTGDFNVDSDKRMNEMADIVSRKIGRELKLRGAF